MKKLLPTLTISFFLVTPNIFGMNQKLTLQESLMLSSGNNICNVLTQLFKSTPPDGEIYTKQTKKLTFMCDHTYTADAFGTPIIVNIQKNKKEIVSLIKEVEDLKNRITNDAESICAQTIIEYLRHLLAKYPVFKNIEDSYSQRIAAKKKDTLIKMLKNLTEHGITKPNATFASVKTKNKHPIKILQDRFRKKIKAAAVKKQTENENLDETREKIENLIDQAYSIKDYTLIKLEATENTIPHHRIAILLANKVLLLLTREKQTEDFACIEKILQYAKGLAIAN